MGSKYDPKGDVRHSQNRSAHSTHENGELLQLQLREMMPEQRRMLEVCKMFQGFLHRDDGYLKVRRDTDGPDVHLTWTWTLGKHHRSYVYVRIGYFNIGYGLELLEGKINQVIEGRMLPTVDRYVK